ncbi:MAG: VWA-like domain-containing protein [Gracilibacteraceae bacterium]|nr:VWA-like domain-containing protein [Gracilibacteraceae bacterium]
MTAAAEQAAEIQALAGDILLMSRNALMINMRFLDTALIRFVPAAARDVRGLATDGRNLFYNAEHILRSYKKAPETVVRDYLHVTLHCVFRHIFVGRKINAVVWDLAADVAVEALMARLDIQAARAPRAAAQTAALERLREEVRPLTAEKLYRYFISQNLPSQDYIALRGRFYADDHSDWHAETGNAGGGDETDISALADDEPDEENIAAGGAGEMTADDSESDSGGPAGGDSGEREETGALACRPGEGEGEENGRRLWREETERQWRDIGERVQVYLETEQSGWGGAAGDMVQELRAVNRERYDYAEFLRRFAVWGENIEVNDEEFDYIFYTYGLRLYRGMPLVEPLEYKETKRIREFVVALDTSQSVAGELVQKFVTKTYNILKQSRNFFTKINVHILQCGASVQEDAKITCDEDFEAYMKDMRLHGFGGTDFRPVFAYANRLAASHEFTNFQGLIYFTDGFGTFPAQKPDYETAFVFIDTGGEIPEVPVWAIKLVLSEEEIDLF